MQKSPQSKARVLPYDALRVIGIFSVLGIHSLMTGRDLAHAPSFIAALDSFLHFAVPLLVFISGGLLWGSNKKVNFKSFAQKRFKRLGLPYAAWFMFYALLAIFTTPELNINLNWFLGNLFSGHVWYHLYFVPMILVLSLLSPFMRKILWMHKAIPFLIFIFSLLCKTYFWPAISSQLHDFNVYVWQFSSHIFMHLPHMILGALFAIYRHNHELKKNEMTEHSSKNFSTILAVSTKKILVSLKNPIIVLVLASSAFLFEPQLKKIEKPLLWLSKNTFGVYFVHPALLLLIQLFLKTYDLFFLWSLPLFYGFVFVSMSLCSFAISNMLQKSEYTAWLIGE